MAIGTATLVALAAASGNFEVPVVAGDTGAGLSADGRTAVLVEHTSHDRTRFAIADRERGRIERIVSLRGDIGYDALSPDGSKLYVISYRSRDHRRYAIQAMRTSDPKPSLETVVEKGEPGERMSGLPITRVSSPSGDWIYTLYDGAHGEPFVHALQANDSFTVCIDLEALEGRRDLSSLELLLTGNRLTVVDARQQPLVQVNTESFEVADVPAVANPAPIPGRPRATTDAHAQPPYALFAAIGLTIAIATLAALSRRRRDRTTAA